MRRLLVCLLLMPSLVWATCPTTDQYSTAVCALSPAHYFRLDDASGTSVTDVGSATSAVTYNGGFTLNTASLLPTITDKAVAINGSTGYFEYAALSTNSADFNPSTTNNQGWSLVWWIKTAAATGGRIFAQGTIGGGAFCYEIYTPNGTQIRWDLSQNGGALYGSVDGTSSIRSGGLHMFAFTSLGGGSNTLQQVSMYDNASLIATASSFTGTFCSTKTLTWDVGRYPSTSANFVTGTYDDIAIIFNQLSGAQVTALYNAGTVASAASRFPFPVRYFERPHRLAPTTIAWSMPSLAVDMPGFVIDRLNRRAIRSRGIYTE